MNKVPTGWRLIFAVLSALAFFIAVFGGDSFGRTAASDIAIGTAIGESFGRVWRDPAPIVFAAVTFWGLYSVTVHVARRAALSWAIAAFALLAFAMLYVFFAAYQEYYQLLESRKWTAATFALASAIGYSAVLLVGAAILSEVAFRSPKKGHEA